MFQSLFTGVRITLQIVGLILFLAGLIHLFKGAKEGREYHALVNPVLEALVSENAHLNDNKLTTHLTYDEVVALKLGQAQYKPTDSLEPWVCFLFILGGITLILVAKDRSTNERILPLKD